MAWLKRVCVLAAFVAVAFVGFLLSLDNATPVALRLLGRETMPLPVYWWLYAAFACGVVVGAGFCLFAHVRGKLAARRLRKAVRERDADLARLRGTLAGADEARMPTSGA